MICGWGRGAWRERRSGTGNNVNTYYYELLLLLLEADRSGKRQGRRAGAARPPPPRPPSPRGWAVEVGQRAQHLEAEDAQVGRAHRPPGDSLLRAAGGRWARLQGGSGARSPRSLGLRHGGIMGPSLQVQLSRWGGGAVRRMARRVMPLGRARGGSWASTP